MVLPAGCVQRWLERRLALSFIVYCSDLQEEISEMGRDEHPSYVPPSRQGLRLDEDRRTQHTLQQVGLGLRAL